MICPFFFFSPRMCTAFSSDCVWRSDSQGRWAVATKVHLILARHCSKQAFSKQIQTKMSLFRQILVDLSSCKWHRFSLALILSPWGVFQQRKNLSTARERNPLAPLDFKVSLESDNQRTLWLCCEADTKPTAITFTCTSLIFIHRAVSQWTWLE